MIVFDCENPVEAEARLQHEVRLSLGKLLPEVLATANQ